MEKTRNRVNVIGIVQGVGFRPFIYNLAKSLLLSGWVKNSGEAVQIEVEGEKESIEAFCERLLSEAPALSHIEKVSRKTIPPEGGFDFEIVESSRGLKENIFISPDVSICEDCRKELFDPGNRRYLYPFINCTNCGPRFTIIKGVPYDRVNTTMAKFEMCGECASEYSYPGDRRYHAQPISCYSCGPMLELLDCRGDRVETDKPVSVAVKNLLEGKIIAVKGIGGYHLACNARDGEAVQRLRSRKIRDDKPFALMVRDFKTALGFCEISGPEKKLLESNKKPIVLLKKKDNCGLPEAIAPGNPFLGIMLPYTPVHELLLNTGMPCRGETQSGELLDAVVMTSGNRSNEPIYYTDKEAVRELSQIADYFLVNDREIYIRTDDTVTRILMGEEYIIRRSRGYVPFHINFNPGGNLLGLPSVLACGAELKNTFCLSRGNNFYMSHHIGDLENLETLDSFEEGIAHFKKVLNIEPGVIAYDMHPEYLSTKYGEGLDSGKKIAVQHHHAHVASCMAENNLDGEVIGVAFDGTGYGEDGNIWGGEFFTGSYRSFRRAAHLDYVKMPGGDAAVREPWRMAAACLYKSFGCRPDISQDVKGVEFGGVRLLDGVDGSRIGMMMDMIDKNINSPLTSSMGRFFDAASAILGIRTAINYEGQAAIELEHYAGEPGVKGYKFTLQVENGVYKILFNDIIIDMVNDIKKGESIRRVSSRFHETIAEIVLETCTAIKGISGIGRVILSGGVFQNLTLTGRCIEKLEDNGFEVFRHRLVPSNDGGLALGQAVIAACRLNEK